MHGLVGRYLIWRFGDLRSCFGHFLGFLSPFSIILALLFALAILVAAFSLPPTILASYLSLRQYTEYQYEAHRLEFGGWVRW